MPFDQQSSDKREVDRKKQFFLNNIAKYCDKCGTPYKPSDLKIVQDSDMSSIIHFKCSKCKSNNIASFVRPLGISSRSPVVSDLQVHELTHFAELPPVDIDDLADIFDLF